MKRSPSGLSPIITIDRKAPTPLHRQIYDAYRKAIIDGSMRPGQRIPSTRVLASELAVSRFPVLNAYAQLLAEGYFTSRVGAGTVVSKSIQKESSSTAPSGQRQVAKVPGRRDVATLASGVPTGQRSPWLLGWGAFGVGQVAVDQFPLQIWSSLVARRARSMDVKSFHYGDAMGSPALRETIANYLRTVRSVRCDAAQIMIVSGSQQALEVAARVLLDRGSRVWFEEPGYRFAREVFALAGARIIPVPVDDEGLMVSAGIKLSRAARLVYVTPSHQFPLGYTMSASRRLQLLSWAQQAGAWIIEDDYDSEYRYESAPVAAMQGIDSDTRVIYIGTFSKVLFPSLRLGYVVIPADLLDRFIAVRRLMDLGAPSLYQEVLADFIGEGHFARHIRRMRVLYRERRNVLVDSIGNELGPMVKVLGSEAGVHLAAVFPEGTRDVDLAGRASEQKLWTWPLSTAYAGDSPSPGFILGFGSTDAREIPKAVRKLGVLLNGK